MGINIPGLTTNQKREASNPFRPIPWSINSDINPKFIVLGYAVLNASGAFSVGQPITWQILDPATGHASTFFNGIDSSGQNVKVLFPTVRNVLNGVAGLDERGSSGMVFAGPAVSFNELEILSTRFVSLNAMLVADGAGGWTIEDSLAAGYVTVTAFGGPGAGETGIDFPQPPFLSAYSQPGMPVTYQGGGNFLVNRRYVGIPNQIVFSLRNAATGAVLVANPAAGERVSVSNITTVSILVRTDLWVLDNFFMSGGAFNYWVSGAFEVWMFAVPVSSTEMEINYQTNFPGATGPYSVFRDTSPTFATQVLVGTGTSGVMLDSGLTPATQYYYKLVADVSGTATDVTTWEIRTPA